MEKTSGQRVLKTNPVYKNIYLGQISSFLLMIMDGSLKRNTYKPAGNSDTSRLTGEALELTDNTVCPVELMTEIVPFPKLPITVTI